MYKIGYPLWRVVAKIGIPLRLRVNIVKDNEAGVYVATSKDLHGLICEAATMDELMTEMNYAISDLLSLELNGKPSAIPVAEFRFAAG